MTRGKQGWMIGAVCFCLLAGTGLAPAVPVTGIRVVNDGAGPLDEGAVLARVSLKVGDEFNANVASRDVKTLKDSERYSYVSVDVVQDGDGVVVVYSVVSRPRIRKFSINGALDFTNKKIKKLMELNVGDRVDDASLAVATQKVVDEYRQKYYPNAAVTWLIEEDAQAGEADVYITVKEGTRAKVKKITFPGLKDSAPARQLLKVMAQQKVNIFSWITGRGVYSPGDLPTDRIAIRRVLLNAGYLDAEVGVPEVTPLRGNKLAIAIPVTEGKQYRMGKITSDGVALFTAQEIMDRVRLAPGDIASMAEVDDARQTFKDYYGFRGYVDTGVEAVLDTVPEETLLNLHLQVTEGKLTYIRNVVIEGNTRTKDKVIRRELTVYPGEVFNQVDVRRSEARLRNTGFFEYVSSTPRTTLNPDEYDLAFEVAEQRTGQFVVGAGFSSIDDIIGFVEIQQGNFDWKRWPFTGGGQKLKARFTLGTSRRDWELSFVEPWFLDRKLSLGLDAFQHDREFLSDDYDQRNTGGTITLGTKLWGPMRGNLGYTFEQIEVENVAETASELIKVEEGSRTKSSLRPEIIFDTRNNPFIPTRGNRTEVGTTLAGGPLGAETDLYEVSLRSSQYWTVFWEHVVSIRSRLGTVEEYDDTERVPIFDRMFLGGARSLRGFEFRDVGPKDPSNPEDPDPEPIGGKTSGFVSLEYTIPLVDKIRFAAFYDAGFVNAESWDFALSDYNSDYGLGIRLDLPGFPLQLDYAWPLEADEFNDSSSGRFNFLIGYLF